MDKNVIEQIINGILQKSEKEQAELISALTGEAVIYSERTGGICCPDGTYLSEDDLSGRLQFALSGKKERDLEKVLMNLNTQVLN